MPDTSNSWFLYLIRCGDGSLYTGIATDVERRLKEHADGKRGAKYLRGRQPLELVYTAPAENRSEASRLESRIKRFTRAEKEALIAGRLSLDDQPSPQTAS